VSVSISYCKNFVYKRAEYFLKIISTSELNVFNAIFDKVFHKILKMNTLLLRIGKMICVLVFMYQIIELTVNYYKFETVIDIRSEKYFDNFPAITFCYNGLYQNSPNHLNRHHKRINHKTIADFIFKSINCNFLYSNV